MSESFDSVYPDFLRSGLEKLSRLDAQHELPEQRLVADAQRVKVIFNLHIRRVPFFQRTAGDLAGNVRQNFQ